MTDLDSLIDVAARAMTTAPPPVNLRASVIDEIRGTSLQAGHSDEAKASYHSGSYHLSPSHMWWLAAAAGIVLAAYLGWPARPTIELPPAPVARTLEELRAPTPRPTEWIVAREVVLTTPTPLALESTIATIPALDAPAAIGIAPLDATSTPLPALDAVEPLDLEQLDIKPLTPPGPAAGGQ